MGPAISPLREAFPGDDGDTSAAWCWTKRRSDGFTSYAVDAAGHKKKVVTISGNLGQPSGPPILP